MLPCNSHGAAWASKSPAVFLPAMAPTTVNGKHTKAYMLISNTIVPNGKADVLVSPRDRVCDHKNDHNRPGNRIGQYCVPYPCVPFICLASRALTKPPTELVVHYNASSADRTALGRAEDTNQCQYDHTEPKMNNARPHR